jgi:hypothetical protein
LRHYIEEASSELEDDIHKKYPSLFAENYLNIRYAGADKFIYFYVYACSINTVRLYRLSKFRGQNFNRGENATSYKFKNRIIKNFIYYIHL